MKMFIYNGILINYHMIIVMEIMTRLPNLPRNLDTKREIYDYSRPRGLSLVQSLGGIAW